METPPEKKEDIPEKEQCQIVSVGINSIQDRFIMQRQKTSFSRIFVPFLQHILFPGKNWRGGTFMGSAIPSRAYIKVG
eukprot:4275681-Ditylum_brightwellii.AAC.1